MRPLFFACAALLALLAPGGAGAQLRPLDPAEWRVWAPGARWVAGVGGGAFREQRASLAGTKGTLLEAGNVAVALRTGRVAFEAGATVQRFFRDEERFAAPHGGAVEPGPDRHDAGDYRIATVVRLTPERSPALAVLRFGTRLPTTDNRVGLDRDQTDFFALLGGRVERAGVALAAETGVSINGTRTPTFEQSDVWVYLLRAEATRGAVAPSLTVTGHMDGLAGRSIRGNEDLGEVRLGVRAGRRRWVRVEVVRGYTEFSPELGVIVAAGVAR